MSQGKLSDEAREPMSLAETIERLELMHANLVGAQGAIQRKDRRALETAISILMMGNDDG